MVAQRGPFAVRPRYIWLALLALSALLFFSYQSRKLEISEKEEELRGLSEEFYAESMRNDSLNLTLSQINTDRYIEQQARKQYGYLMPDEIRYVLVGAPGTNEKKQVSSQQSTQATSEPTAAPAAVVQLSATPVPTIPPAAQVQQEAVAAPTPVPAAEERDWVHAFE